MSEDPVRRVAAAAHDAQNGITDEHTALVMAVRVLIGYWGSLDAIPETDKRPTEYFVRQLDKRMATLRQCVHRVSWDDWIIQGVKGELYACKPDIFAATYEPVDTEEVAR